MRNSKNGEIDELNLEDLTISKDVETKSNELESGIKEWDRKITKSHKLYKKTKIEKNNQMENTKNKKRKKDRKCSWKSKSLKRDIKPSWNSKSIKISHNPNLLAEIKFENQKSEDKKKFVIFL